MLDALYALNTYLQKISPIGCVALEEFLEVHRDSFSLTEPLDGMTRDRVLTVIARLDQVAEARRSKSFDALKSCKNILPITRIDRHNRMYGIIWPFRLRVLSDASYRQFSPKSSYNCGSDSFGCGMLLLVGFVATKFVQNQRLADRRVATVADNLSQIGDTVIRLHLSLETIGERLRKIEKNTDDLAVGLGPEADKSLLDLAQNFSGDTANGSGNRTCA